MLCIARVFVVITFVVKGHINCLAEADWYHSHSYMLNLSNLVKMFRKEVENNGILGSLVRKVTEMNSEDLVKSYWCVWGRDEIKGRTLF